MCDCCKCVPGSSAPFKHELSQDFQLVVLGVQLVSVVLGGLQLGVQLSFDLQRDAVSLPVQ